MLALPAVFNIELGTICQFMPPFVVYINMPLSPTATDKRVL